jgi:hypothetical protein
VIGQFFLENLKERGILEDKGVEDSILKLNLKTELESVVWIHLAQDMVQW